MKIKSLLMIEGDLIALAARAVFDGCFPFAMAVRIAAAMRLSEHEVLFARDAAAPQQRYDEQQRKQRTGERPHQITIIEPQQRDRRHRLIHQRLIENNEISVSPSVCSNKAP